MYVFEESNYCPLESKYDAVWDLMPGEGSANTYTVVHLYFSIFTFVCILNSEVYTRQWQHATECDVTNVWNLLHLLELSAVTRRTDAEFPDVSEETRVKVTQIIPSWALTVTPPLIFSHSGNTSNIQ